MEQSKVHENGWLTQEIMYKPLILLPVHRSGWVGKNYRLFMTQILQLFIQHY